MRERGRRFRTARTAVPVVLAALAAAAPAAGAPDPAIAALGARDAYVSPRVLGPAAAGEEAVLAEAAAALRAERRPVKLAVVIGPAGAPSLQAYARRLAGRLGFEGTLLVTRRRGGVASVGPRPTSELTVRLRAAEVGRIANPVERLTRAAGLVAVPLADEEGRSWRPAVALLALGLLGGAWATAMGMGREARIARRDLAERRAGLRVRLDALRAHAIALAGHPGLPGDERRHVEEALGAYAEIVAAAAQAGTVEALSSLDARIDAGLATLSGVAGRAGAPHPRGDIFAGLCTVDPGHGPATATGEVDGRAGAGVCAACGEAAATGVGLAARRIPHGRGSAPYADGKGSQDGDGTTDS